MEKCWRQVSYQLVYIGRDHLHIKGDVETCREQGTTGFGEYVERDEKTEVRWWNYEKKLE